VWEQAVRWLFGSAGVSIVSHARDIDRAADLLARSGECVLIVDADEDLEAGRLLRRVRELLRSHPSTPVVVVCARGDDVRHDAALASGANAVVWRDDAFDLLDAIEAVSDGSSRCDPERRLTLRELEILRLVAEGRTNREVSRAVWVTEQTVKYHLANIYRRLGVGSRREATAWAIEHGVVDGEHTS
jgi:DNA-binding NarL/FixJ family response regulator